MQASGQHHPPAAFSLGKNPRTNWTPQPVWRIRKSLTCGGIRTPDCPTPRLTAISVVIQAFRLLLWASLRHLSMILRMLYQVRKLPPIESPREGTTCVLLNLEIRCTMNGQFQAPRALLPVERASNRIE